MIEGKIEASDFDKDFKRLQHRIFIGKTKASQIKVGDIVAFGRAIPPKKKKTSGSDNHEKASYRKPLEWIVAAVDSDRALLICTTAVECLPFNRKMEERKIKSLSTQWRNSHINWKYSSLRRWLNTYFFFRAFKIWEKRRILTTLTCEGNGRKYGMLDRQYSEDRIFLLSLEEARGFFADDEARTCFYKGKECLWWLRSQGRDAAHAATVECIGFVSEVGQPVSWDSIGVRPALCYKLKD